MCVSAGDAGPSLQRELEKKRDELIANYARQRDDLMQDLVPQVRLVCAVSSTYCVYACHYCFEGYCA